MNQEKWRRIEDIYRSAIDLEDAARQTLIEKMCAGDAELYAEIKALLDESLPDDFLSESTLTLGLSILVADEKATLIGKTIGHYRVVRQIGSGGMGEVYLAEDLLLERSIALKVLPSYVTEKDNVRRFKHEARAASAISHPNVAHIYEIGEDRKRLFIAMEYIDGDTLRKRISERTLKLGKAVDIALQTASAIGAAHAEGVIHRDIKPDNIIVRPDDLVKVVDFGLAKLTDAWHSPQRIEHPDSPPRNAETKQLTQPGILMGTANYMSPEQVRGQKIDTRADIWSWGIVFYEMLLGEPPFRGATNSDVISEILKSEPPPLRSDLPETAVRIVRKTLSKDRLERYENAAELIKDLRRLLDQIEKAEASDVSLPIEDKAFSENAAEKPSDTAGGIPRVSNDSRLSTRSMPAENAETEESFFSSMIAELNKAFAPRRGLLLGGFIFLLIAFFAVYDPADLLPPAEKGSNSDEAQVTHLTKTGRVLDTAISPDGKILAYVPIESGKHSLWTRNLKTGEEVQLLPAEASLCWGMRFTPDGQNLLYIKTPPGASVSDLYKISSGGGQPRKVSANVAAPPAVSPDGSRIAFVRTLDSPPRDVLVIAETSGETAERELASRFHPDRFATSGASWSPNGKFIALGAGRKNDIESAILSFPVDGGGEPFEMTPWQWAAVGGVAWDGDGRTLVFSAREIGSRVLRIWRLKYPGGEPQSITDEENSYEEVTLAPAENLLAATHTFETSDIWTIDPAGVVRRLTTGGHHGADGLAATPAGRIIYTVGEYEQSVLWGMNLDGTNRKPLIENTGFLPSASRDGRFVAYVSTEKGVHHIWIMKPDGSDNRQLTNGEGEMSPSLTPDGEWVVYASRGQKHGSLWKTPTGGGRPVRLTHEGIYARPVVSPDGTMIACAFRAGENEKWQIAVLPIAGGAPVKTFPALPSARGQMIRWTADSRAVLYLEKRDGAHNLWRQPLDGSAPTRITNFTEDIILHHDAFGAENFSVLARGGRMRNIALIRNYK